MTNPGPTNGSPTSTNLVIDELWTRIQAQLGVGNGAVTQAQVDAAISAAVSGKANSADLTAGLLAKAAAVHTHTSAQVTDIISTIQSTVAALIKAGSNVTTAYDSTAKTLTINSTGGGGGTTDAEIVRDTIGGALVASTGITINVDDSGDTITISVSNIPQSAIANLGTTLAGKSNTGHTHSVSDLTATGTKDATTYLAGDNTFKPISSLSSVTTPATRSAPFCFELCHTAIGSAALAGFHLRRPWQLGIKPDRFRIHFCNRVQLSDGFIAGEAGKLYGLNVVVGKPGVDANGDINGTWAAAPTEILAPTDVAAGTIASSAWLDSTTFPVDLDVMQMLGYSFQSGNTASGQVAYNGGFSFRDQTPANLKVLSPATALARSDNASFLQVIIEYEHKDTNATHLLNFGNSLSGPSANSGATPLPITNYGELGTFHQLWARRHRCSAASVAVAGAYASHFLSGNTRLDIFDNFNIPYVPDVIFGFAPASSDIADCTSASTSADVKTNIRNVVRRLRAKWPNTLKQYWTNVPPRNNFSGSRATNTTNEYFRNDLNNWFSNSNPMQLTGVIDVDEMLSDFADPGRLLYPFTTEGVHLTSRAHQNISEKVPAGRK